MLPTLLIHNLQSPIFQGEPYGLLTSTDIVPGMGLGAAARVGPRVREEVYKALAALNVSHPLSAGAGITGFAAHLSYELPRTVARKVRRFRVQRLTVLRISKLAHAVQGEYRRSLRFSNLAFSFQQAQRFASQTFLRPTFMRLNSSHPCI